MAKQHHQYGRYRKQKHFFPVCPKGFHILAQIQQKQYLYQQHPHEQTVLCRAQAEHDKRRTDAKIKSKDPLPPFPESMFPELPDKIPENQ